MTKLKFCEFVSVVNVWMQGTVKQMLSIDAMKLPINIGWLVHLPLKWDFNLVNWLAHYGQISVFLNARTTLTSWGIVDAKLIDRILSAFACAWEKNLSLRFLKMFDLTWAVPKIKLHFPTKITGKMDGNLFGAPRRQPLTWLSSLIGFIGSLPRHWLNRT